MSITSLLMVAATVFLTLMRTFGKLAAPHIHPIVAGFFMHLAAFVFMALIFLAIRPEIKAQLTFHKGLLFAALAGVAAVTFDILVFTIFKLGGSLSVFTVVVNAGSILLAVLIGVLFLKESLTLVQYASVGVVLVGIYFLLK